MEYKLQPYGHNAWLIRFISNGFSKSLCLNILKLSDIFRSQTNGEQKHIWQEVVPAYDSLLLKTAHNVSRQMSQTLMMQTLERYQSTDIVTVPDRLIDIPVSYGGELSLIHI